MPAFSTGFTPQLLASLKVLVPTLTDNIRVALITIANFPSFYDLFNKTESIVPDPNDIVKPLVRPVPLAKCRSFFLDIIDELQRRGPSSPQHFLMSGVLLAEQLLRDTGGILVIACVNSPPTVCPRAASSLESSFLRLCVEDYVYREVGFRLNNAKISYHIFCTSFNTPIADLATIAVPAGLTGGAAHTYNSFAAFHTDLYRTLTAQYFWNAVLHVQWSPGIALKKAFGNFIIESNNVVRFPVLRADQATAYELDIRDALKPPYVVFQAVLHYTDGDGRRIARVMAYRQPLTADPALLRGSLDEAAAAVFLAKAGSYDVLTNGAAEGRKALKKRLARVLPGPPRFELLEWLMDSMIYGRLFRDQPIGEIDRRVEAIVWTRGASFVDVLLSLYPRVVALDDQGDFLLADGSAFAAGRVLLFHTEAVVYVWVSAEAGEELMQGLFGVTEIPVGIGEGRANASRKR
jgi:hypothetical protein